MRSRVAWILFLCCALWFTTERAQAATNDDAEKHNPTAEPVKADKPEIDKGELLGHIKYLSSPELRGREAGTPDQLKAAEYIANEFKRYGLEPYGTPAKEEGAARGYYQDFNLPISKGPAKDTALKITIDGKEEDLELNKHFVPVPAGTKPVKATGEVAFAGYGIASGKYDDFAGLDLEGKWALVLRYEPQEKNPHGNKITKDSFLGTKIQQCFLHGAVGVLIVTGPEGHEEEGDEAFIETKGPLVGEFKGPVFSLKRAAVRKLFANTKESLAELQRGIDKDLKPHSMILKDVKLSGLWSMEIDPGMTRNIVARLEGRDPELKKEYVIVGAHSDHVGDGRFGSTWGKRGAGQIHPGADDNASGTAGVLEIAQYFASLKGDARPKRSILFICFSGEEKGLLGSIYNVQHPLVPLADTVAMLNLDMIGRSKDGSVQLLGLGTSPGFRDLIHKENKDSDLKLREGSGGEGPSDHDSYYKAKIPVLFFFTGTHPDYHNPGDTWDRINAPVAEAVAKLAAKAAQDIADLAERPKFADAPSNGWLGIAPDQAADQKGYVIARVSPNSPADKAGLQDGDVIVEMNAQPIDNMMDLMMNLIGYAAGDEIELKVTHGTKSQVKKLVLGERPAKH